VGYILYKGMFPDEPFVKRGVSRIWGKKVEIRRSKRRPSSFQIWAHRVMPVEEMLQRKILTLLKFKKKTRKYGALPQSVLIELTTTGRPDACSKEIPAR